MQSQDFELVETIGIEPMTSCMSSKRSNHLGYASVTKYLKTSVFIVFCVCFLSHKAVFQLFTVSSVDLKLT